MKIVFYEKPGCINNTKQKRLLEAAGHELDTRNLLTETWDEQTLLKYFSGKPVTEWFNTSAPAVKSGVVQPGCLTGEAAIALMMHDPLLIRRPLMSAGEVYQCGFDPLEVDRWVGLAGFDTETDIETCPHGTETAMVQTKNS